MNNLVTVQSLDLILFKGRWFNPMLYVIMQRTSSTWTHATIVRGGTKLYDATVGGVCINDLSHYKGRQCAVLRYKNEIPKQKKITMIQWLDKQAADSVPYDYTALFGFLTGLKKLDNENAWYCSELPYWLFHDFGMPLFNGNKTFIYPSDLYRCNDFDIVFEGKV